MFLAKEVAECIEYDKSSLNKLVASVDDDEKARNIVPTLGGNQEVWMLTEAGLYEVLMQSRKPIAKQFKKGVKQILHDVRTTGGYIATRQDDTPEEIMAKALNIAQQTLAKREERLKQLEAQSEQQQATIELQTEQIKQAAPKVAYVDTVLQSVNTYAANLIAKELGMSAETLNRKLKERGVLYKQGGVWVLTAKYQDKGYTKTRTHTYTRSDGSTGTSMLTVWTERGRAFIHKLFNEAKTA